MNAETAVLVIDDEHEAMLVASAIALHAPRVKVRTVPSWQAALQYLADARLRKILPRLVILGGRAVAGAENTVAGLEMPVVGVVPDLSARTRDHALAAGVQAVYTRPVGWEEYSAMVSAILRRWLTPATSR